MYKAGVVWNARSLGNVQEEVKNAELTGVTVVSWFSKPSGHHIAGIAYVGSLCMGDGYNIHTCEGYDSKRMTAHVRTQSLIPVYQCMYFLLMIR